MGTIVLFVFMALCLAIGWGFLYLFSKAIEKTGSRESEYMRLQSLYSTRQIDRRDKRAFILDAIGAPECPDGTFSPWQNKLWDQYKELEAAGKLQTTAEITHLVETRGYIPDEYADIIEGKR
jgi:hypothetical protein